MSPPALALWALVFVLALLRGTALIYAALTVNVMMSLQMMPGSGGGSTLLPVSVFEAAIVARFLLTPGNVLQGLDAALDMRRLGLLSAFLVYGLIGALVLPRMFAGSVAVIPVAGASLDGPSLLAPRSGNYTQSGYMAISCMTALAFAVIGQRRELREHVLRAILCFALALIVTGLADMFATSLLEPFRTASYDMLIDAQAAGMKRVVGLTPEASTFGSLCIQAVAALLFLRPLYRPGWERGLANVALAGVAAMAFLSTSSTAYVGGFVVACLYGLDLARRMRRVGAPGRDGLAWEIMGLTLAAIAVAIAIAFAPGVTHWVYDLLDKLIFTKTSTSSYIQRSMWTRIGWQSFLDTGGLGVGLGSVRTSNWVVSITASTGVLGAALMFGFMLQKLFAPFGRMSEWDRSFAWGLKLFIVPSLVMSLLAGTIPDLGIMLSMTLGLLSAGSLAKPIRGPIRTANYDAQLADKRLDALSTQNRAA